ASGASAIAVPGWPALAYCTASIDRPRIVSIESLRMSVSASTGPMLSRGALESHDRVRAVLRRRPGHHPLLRDIWRSSRPRGPAGNGVGHPDDRVARGLLPGAGRARPARG